VIVLDTNVLSELMRPRPSPAVLRWVDEKPTASLCTTSVTQAELLHGIFLLPRGKRRDAIAALAETLFARLEGRVLPFGSDAVRVYAEIAATRRAAGRPIGAFDAQIAAIARAAGAELATRNGDDFEGCGVVVVDPWKGRG
jgi:predicted nucleic acid-binding protein